MRPPDGVVTSPPWRRRGLIHPPPFGRPQHGAHSPFGSAENRILVQSWPLAWYALDSPCRAPGWKRSIDHAGGRSGPRPALRGTNLGARFNWPNVSIPVLRPYYFCAPRNCRAAQSAARGRGGAALWPASRGVRESARGRRGARPARVLAHGPGSNTRQWNTFAVGAHRESGTIPQCTGKIRSAFFFGGVGGGVGELYSKHTLTESDWPSVT